MGKNIQGNGVNLLNKKPTIKERIKKLAQFLFNPRFLICFGIAWMITNGWSYLLLGLGMYFDISWMKAIATSYLTFLWLPISPEKVITIAISIALLKKLFPTDQKTLAVLKKWSDSFKKKKKEYKQKKNEKKRRRKKRVKPKFQKLKQRKYNKKHKGP